MSDGTVRTKAAAAREAALAMAKASDGARRDALERFAALLLERRGAVEAANGKDVEAADEAVAAGEMPKALRDRLPLRGAKLTAAAEGVRAVAAQPDPLGRVARATRLDAGLTLRQVTVPMGVVACAFEARPDAAVQIAALGVRTGNAVLLKGGSEAAASNAAVADLAREALRGAGLPPDAVQLLEGRGELQALLALDDLVDLLIPRGSGAFVRYVMDHTRIPVLGHAEGVCHTYVDRDADLDAAVGVCVDAKTDYPAACNATEAFLVHRDAAEAFVPRLVAALQGAGVEVRVDADAARLAAGDGEATDDDRGREYGDLVASVFLVESLEAAVSFVNAHGSGHTDAILTRDAARARRFVEGVDAASVMVNASTRFADGYRYGLGAEVGISTGKVHARGPVGQEGLTTTKWIVTGAGHRAGDYQGEGARPFLHEPLDEEAADGHE